ncbi:MAG: diphosphomevalonate decarboxylase [Microbacteriaceae bacterium]|nr:diphosphomevalonate decarboxylase [Microbacteriaceae bacterium]
MTVVSAVAHPNIALVKYWGKRDERLILPVAGSLSMTLDTVATQTTVRLGAARGDVAEASAAGDFSENSDVFYLNGRLETGKAARQVSEFLDRVRKLSGSSAPATVVSHNDAPTAAGLASSASGFAALARAAAAAYGLDLSTRELSILARQGSGSACRSVIDKFAVWHAGDSSETSFAEQVEAPDMRMIVCEISGAQKPVSSRVGMQLTRDTSPFWSAWAPSTEQLLGEALAACAADDFTRLGELTETHGLRMHALIMSAQPPVRYLAPASFAAYDRVAELRASGVEAYATADAGPNVVAIALPADAEKVAAALAEFGSVHIAAPGRGAYLTEAALEVPEVGE